MEKILARVHPYSCTGTYEVYLWINMKHLFLTKKCSMDKEAIDFQRISTVFLLSGREGVVQEYVSYDVGLIRLLDEDRGVALFSVEQVRALLYL